MKKILHVSKYFYPYYGGIEDVTRTIITELKPYFEQRVICFNHKKGTVHNINGVDDILRIGVYLTLASQPISLSYRWKLQKIINSYKPDYIHLHLPNPLIASYILTLNLYGARIITHWHADILGKRYFYLLYKPFERRILEKSYKIIATSEVYMKDSLPLKEFLDKTVILPNTIDETKFKLFEGEQAEIEKIRKRFDNKKIVFSIGRHVFYKGIDYLIEAEKRIEEDCVIVIAGTGEQSSKLKEIAGNNPRIKFIGRLSNSELKYYLYASSVFAFPSHNRSEAFGVALAEALYCGLPAVSFHIEGSGTLWVNKNNHTGFVVENKNVSEFAGAISKILASDKLRNEMSENAKEWARCNFLKDYILPVMNEVYS
jgi:Glycosyltransferase